MLSAVLHCPHEPPRQLIVMFETLELLAVMIVPRPYWSGVGGGCVEEPEGDDQRQRARRSARGKVACERHDDAARSARDDKQRGDVPRGARLVDALAEPDPHPATGEFSERQHLPPQRVC